MPRTKLPKGSVPVTFNLQREVHRLLLDQARRQEMSLSELIRHALQREIKIAGPARGAKRNIAANGGRRK